MAPVTLNKHQAYRRRNVAAGLCPHCRKPCAPYYECDDRRFYKKVQRTLRRMEEAGILDSIIDQNGHRAYGIGENSATLSTYCVREDDPRRLPRLHKKPVNVDNLIEVALTKAIERKQGAVTEDEIRAELGKIRLQATSASAP